MLEYSSETMPGSSTVAAAYTPVAARCTEVGPGRRVLCERAKSDARSAKNNKQDTPAAILDHSVGGPKASQGKSPRTSPTPGSVHSWLPPGSCMKRVIRKLPLAKRLASGAAKHKTASQVVANASRRPRPKSATTIAWADATKRA